MKRPFLWLASLSLLGHAAAATGGVNIPPRPLTQLDAAAPAPIRPAVDTDNGRIRIGSEQTSTLTSVGADLMWLVGDQNLEFTLDRDEHVTITLSNPALDLRDYQARRLSAPYADERYSAAPTATTYTLLRGKQVIRELTFTPEDAPRDSAALVDGPLEAGTYTLRVSTTGNAKNSFGLSTTAGVFTASQVNVTVTNEDWGTIAYFLPSETAATVEIYDTDGEGELQLRLVQDGNILDVPGSIAHDLDTVTVTVPPSPAATALQARLADTRRQHTNTVGITAPEVLTIAPTPAEPEPKPEPQPAPVPEPEPQPEPEPVPVAEPQPEPEPAPAPVAQEQLEQLSRESWITLKLNTTARGTVIVEHTLPAGATLDASSVKVDGLPSAASLKVSGEHLYFAVPANTSEIQYHVTHDGPLTETLSRPRAARLSGTQLEPLQGEVNLQRWQQARAVTQDAPAVGTGLIRYPAEGSTVQRSDHIEIVRDAGGEAVPTVRVGGQDITSQLGLSETHAAGEGSSRFVFYGVAFEPGRNVIEVDGERREVFAAGTAIRAEFTALSFSDGSNDSVIKVRVLDAAGLPAQLPNVTLNIEGAQPASADALPEQVGYQLALENGTGLLRLKPGAGGTVTLRAQHLKGEQRLRLPGQGGIAVASGSVTLPLSRDITLSHAELDGRFVLERPVAGGWLSAVGDSQGLQTLSETTVPRQLVTGDASQLQQPLTARGPVAVLWEDDQTRVKYALRAARDPLTGKTAPGDGLYAEHQRGPWSVIGTAALDTTAQAQRYTTDNSVFILEPDLKDLSLELSGTKDGLPIQIPLVMGEDYTYNPLTGTVVLSRTPAALKPGIQGETVTAVFYRQNDNVTKGDFSTTWSVAGRYAAGTFSGESASPSGTEVIAGVYSEDNVTTFGTRVRYEQPELSAQVLALYSGGYHISAELKGQSERLSYAANLHSKTEGYRGALKGSAGTRSEAELRYQLSGDPSNGMAVKGLIQTGFQDERLRGEVLGEYSKNGFTVAAGPGYGSAMGLHAVLEAGINKNFGVKLRHLQPFNGMDAVTTLKGSVPINEYLSLTAQDRVEWTPDGPRQTGSLGAEGQFGVSRYDVSYDLPNVSGGEGRLRAGVRSEWPLNANTRLSAYTNVQLHPTWGGVVGGDLVWRNQRDMASLGAEAALEDGKRVFSVKTSASISRSAWTFSEQGRSFFGDRQGHDYALGAALRGEQLSVLGTARYQQGVSTGREGLSLRAEANYALASTDLKAGAFYQSSNASSDGSYYGYVGATQWLTNRFAVGANYGLSGQLTPGTSLNHVFGIEGTWVPIPGLGVSLGYTHNPVSGPALPVRAQHGLYLRADALLRNEVNP